MYANSACTLVVLGGECRPGHLLVLSHGTFGNLSTSRSDECMTFVFVSLMLLFMFCLPKNWTLKLVGAIQRKCLLLFTHRLDSFIVRYPIVLEEIAISLLTSRLLSSFFDHDALEPSGLFFHDLMTLNDCQICLF